MKLEVSQCSFETFVSCVCMSVCACVCMYVRVCMHAHTLSWGKKCLNITVVGWNLVERRARGERVPPPDDNPLQSEGEQERRKSLAPIRALSSDIKLTGPANGAELTCWPAGCTINASEAPHINELHSRCCDASLPTPVALERLRFLWLACYALQPWLKAPLGLRVEWATPGARGCQLNEITAS